MQRYAADELDQIADDERDKTITLAHEIGKTAYQDEKIALAAEIRARISLAQFCRRDATRMRQLAALHAKRDSV